MRHAISISAVLVLAGLMACGTPPKPTPTPVDAAQEAPALSEREAELSDPQRQEWLKQDLAAFNQDNPGLLNASQQEALEQCEPQACSDLTQGPFGVRYDKRGSIRVPFWGKACLAGLGHACWNIAVTYQFAAKREEGSYRVHAGTPEVLNAKALSYLDRACRLNVEECASWAQEAIHAPATQERAVAKLKEACAQESKPACSILAEQYLSGDILPQDLTAAREFSLHACRIEMSGDFRSIRNCLTAGNMMLKGVGGPKEVEEALVLLEPHCAPDSAAWMAVCTGDPQPFGESCGFRWRLARGAGCLPLAEHWLASGDPMRAAAAQRLLSTTCTTLPKPEDAQEVLLACQRWGDHLKATGAAEPILTRWSKMICQRREDFCIEDTKKSGGDVRDCFIQNSECSDP